MRAVLVALLALGCSTTIERGIKDCPEYSTEALETAEELFAEAWLAFDGRDVRREIRRSNVMCTDFIDYDAGPNMVTMGITFSPSDVVIATRPLAVAGGVQFLGPRLRLSETAIMHEFIHVALWVLEGTPDATHAEPPGPWEPEHDLLASSISGVLARAGF